MAEEENVKVAVRTRPFNARYKVKFFVKIYAI